MAKTRACFLCNKSAYLSEMTIYRKTPDTIRPDGIVCAKCARSNQK